MLKKQILSGDFFLLRKYVKVDGKLTVPNGCSGYDQWMARGQYYLGYYNWTKVEQ